MGKSDRRLARIEERLDALEARLPLLLEKSPQESVMDRIHDKIVEAGVNADNFDDLEQEVREHALRTLPSVESPPKIPEKRDIVDLERQAYKLREEGLEWSEIEQRLDLKAPWLAAGRWRKKLKLASEAGN